MYINKHELCVDLNLPFLQKIKWFMVLTIGWAVLLRRLLYLLDIMWAHAHSFALSADFKHAKQLECHKEKNIMRQILLFKLKTAVRINHHIIIIITDTCSVSHSFLLRWLIIFVLWTIFTIYATNKKKKELHLST